MKLGIMQPYFLPYIGYFQLMKAVDQFIVYNNIKFSKKGWVQRNRMLLDGKDFMFSLPLKKDSDFLNISQRYLADSYPEEREKILRRINSAYRKAEYYCNAMPVIERCFNYDNLNLFEFVFNSLKEIKHYLEIDTDLLISSEKEVENSLNGKHRVIALCKTMNSEHYINAIGGTMMYDKNDFINHGIRLEFIKTKKFSYTQLQNDFIPNLSILDVMMFNSVKEIKEMLTNYELC